MLMAASGQSVGWLITTTPAAFREVWVCGVCAREWATSKLETQIFLTALFANLALTGGQLERSTSSIGDLFRTGEEITSRSTITATICLYSWGRLLMGLATGVELARLTATHP